MRIGDYVVYQNEVGKIIYMYHTGFAEITFFHRYQTEFIHLDDVTLVKSRHI